MRAILALLGIAAIIVIILMSLGMISFEQDQAAQLPSLKIEGGQAPEFDVDVGEIDVTTENRTIEVPTIDVQKAGEAEQSKAPAPAE